MSDLQDQLDELADAVDDLAIRSLTLSRRAGHSVDLLGRLAALMRDARARDEVVWTRARNVKNDLIQDLFRTTTK